MPCADLIQSHQQFFDANLGILSVDINADCIKPDIVLDMRILNMAKYLLFVDSVVCIVFLMKISLIFPLFWTDMTHIYIVNNVRL